MNLSRRSFFGTAAAAAVAAPSVGSAALKAAPRMETLKLAIDGAAISEALEPLKYVAGVGRSFDFGDWPCGYPGIAGRGQRGQQKNVYAYRTGFPSIDGLRSISGVHKALMEQRHVENGRRR